MCIYHKSVDSNWTGLFLQWLSRSWQKSTLLWRCHHKLHCVFSPALLLSWKGTLTLFLSFLCLDQRHLQDIKQGFDFLTFSHFQPAAHMKVQSPASNFQTGDLFIFLIRNWLSPHKASGNTASFEKPQRGLEILWNTRISNCGCLHIWERTPWQTPVCFSWKSL